jgi:DNA sulfur modification protein DndD
MQITKLILDNFSSYENRYEINFTTDKLHPIVLIGGQNGAGKTSIFTAIKLALYGPLAFGYTGANSFYYKKIRSLINSKAFQNDDFTSCVAIEVLIKTDREMKKYAISRQWNIVEGKLAEVYEIRQDDELIEGDEKSFFENYLNAIIPPDLFDFFLFDGEEIGAVFSSDNYNKYIKNALLTMCGIDIFAIVQSFCKSYISKTKCDEDSENEVRFNKINNEIYGYQEQINRNQTKVKKLTQEIEELKAEIEYKEFEFVRAGGVKQSELNRLEEQALDYEKERVQLSQSLKSFMELQMPFYLLKGFSNRIQSQIDYEEKVNIYDYVKYMVSKEFINGLIDEKTDNSMEISTVICDAILSRLKPKEGVYEDLLFDLSRDDVGRIENLISDIEDIDLNQIICNIKNKDRLTKSIAKINKITREALSEDEARQYRLDIERARMKLRMDEEQLSYTFGEISSIETQLMQMNVEREKLYQQIIEKAQNKHVYELSNSIEKIMNSLIETKTSEIRKLLAVKTVDNLHQIYRKDNLISEMFIDSNFSFELYQNQIFTIDELKSLISNLGISDFVKTVGMKSVYKLYDYFKVNSESMLKHAIDSCDEVGVCFDLNKRVELNILSKGERQIFILALYWAIIQISDKKIPFIIDTPYARIDANHREEISKKFFPYISEQVIILSTDEEITEEYYRIIKPFISREYLLTNNQDENRTTISEGYFFQ